MPDPWGSVDPLGEALQLLRMNGVFYCRSEFTAPWGLVLPPFAACMMFHVVVSGGCLLEVDGAAPCALGAGDLALVPHGEGHRLVSETGATAQRLFDVPRDLISDRYEILRLGGGGAATTVVCGLVRFDHPAARHVVPLLPKVIDVRVWTSPEEEWIRSTLRFIAAEARALKPGSEMVIARLADVLVIQAIRSWIAREPEGQRGWLGALRDEKIGRAIALVHRDPCRTWTLAALASAAGMSRSAFAARFTRLVGESAMRYVTRWKMYAAAALLKDEGLALGQMASRLGYESESAFSRAFKRYVGISPGAARREPPPVSGP
jgi:AraC-like DNA-binding protein